MKKSELQKIIREEVRKVLKEAKEVKDPKEIIKYLKNGTKGTYLFGGDQADEVHQQFRGFSLNTKLTPIFFTDNPTTNITNLINWAEKTFPEHKGVFTIADVENGEIDVRTT